jgi:hypothetical protein
MYIVSMTPITIILLNLNLDVTLRLLQHPVAMQDLETLARTLQAQLQDLPNLLDRVEGMSIAEADALSNKLFASARDLTAFAGAVVANSARKFSCSCVQSPSRPPTPPLVSHPSQDTEEYQGSFPPFPFTQILHNAGFQCNLDEFVQLPSLQSSRTTQFKMGSLPDTVSSSINHSGADESAYDRFPFMSTIVRA